MLIRAVSSLTHCALQVLTELGWLHDAEAGRQATLVSRVPDPAKALSGAPGSSVPLALPYRRGHAYIDRLPNYTLIGGSKYEQWRAKEQWLASSWTQTGPGSRALGAEGGCGVEALATPLFPEQYVLTEPAQCAEFFQRYMYNHNQPQQQRGRQRGAPRVWFLKQAVRRTSLALPLIASALRSPRGAERRV
eukprot:COSAG03_NODE_2321_length_2885_cov_17.353912_2_plen_191_part_00